MDVNTLEDPNDILCDDMGMWINNGVGSGQYDVSIVNGEVNTIQKSSSDNEAAYTLKRVYRVHKNYDGLKKLTVSIFGMLMYCLSR